MKRYKDGGKKILSGIFIFGIIFQNVFFFFPKFANAQAQSSGGIGDYFGGSLDIGGLGATIISCAFPNGIVNAIGGLINGIGGGDDPTGGDTGGDQSADENQTFGDLGGSTGMGMSDTVPVNDQNAIDAIGEADENLTAGMDDNDDAESNGNVDQGSGPSGDSGSSSGGFGSSTLDMGSSTGVLVDIREEEEKDTKKERCFDKIARYVAVKMLDEITLATVEWINSGFEGQPLWWEDPFGFLGNIAKDEINSVTAVFTDPDKIIEYPFGQAIMTAILQDLQRDFYVEAQISLNDVLAHGTYEEFHEDFSVGGWVGYTALFETNNNPFGAYFETQDHLSRRISGTSISTAMNFRRELQESGGFLSQRKCVESGTGSNDYIAPDDESEGQFYVPSGGPIPDAVYEEAEYDPDEGIPQTEDQAFIIDTYVLRSKCAEWRNLTPGGVISDQIKTAVTIPTNQLLSVDELNESIGLIIDALLNQLVTQGLSSLSGDDPSTNVALAQVQGYQPGSVQNGIEDPPSTTEIITGGGDLIDYSLTEVQGYYIQNIALALPILYTNGDSLIKKIRGLDFCVPGPNPRWITDSEDALVTLIQNTPQFLQQPVDSDNQDGIEQNEVDAANDINEAHYADLIETMTGIEITHGPEMDRYDEFIDFMENVFIKYNQRMQQDFSLTQAPPSVRVVLTGLFNDMENYMNQISFMQDYLINIDGVLDILASVEAELANLQSQNGGVLDENDPAVQAQLSIYDQISDQIVSEQDLQDLIAAIDSYNAQSSIMDGHINSCIAQTNSGNYPDSTQREVYPSNLIYYGGYVSFPAPDNDGFLPGISLGDGSNNSIDVTFGGVDIASNSNGLDVFETTLENVY